MSTKTLSELKDIVENNGAFVEDARQAAIWELEKRILESENNSETKQELVLNQKENVNKTSNPFQFNKNDTFITEDPSAPELYSKKSILVFSIMFSTIFGAVLLMSNLNAVNNQKAKIGVLSFAVIYTGLIIMVVNQFEIKTNIGLPLNIIGGFLLTGPFWNNEIGRDFLHRKKKIWKPLVISFLIMIPFILAIIYTV